MTMYAITGTNGKTTTSFLVAAALQAAGRARRGDRHDRLPAGRSAGRRARTTVTTPESPELQALLARMRDGGADSMVMEASSHALALGRVDAIRFDVAAFTNFGRDHLDFHGDLESYFEAKASLFTLRADPGRGAQHRRPAGGGAAAALPSPPGSGCVTVGLDDAGADYRAEHWATIGALTQVDAVLAGRRLRVRPGAARGLQRPQRAHRAGHDRSVATSGVGGSRTRRDPVGAGGVDLERAAAAGWPRPGCPAGCSGSTSGRTRPTVVRRLRPHAAGGRRGAGGAGRTPACVVVLGCGGDRDPAQARARWVQPPLEARRSSWSPTTTRGPRTRPRSGREVLAGAREAAARRLARRRGRRRRRSPLGHRARAATGRRRATCVAVLGKGHETGPGDRGRDPSVLRRRRDRGAGLGTGGRRVIARDRRRSWPRVAGARPSASTDPDCRGRAVTADSRGSSPARSSSPCPASGSTAMTSSPARVAPGPSAALTGGAGAGRAVPGGRRPAGRARRARPRLVDIGSRAAACGWSASPARRARPPPRTCWPPSWRAPDRRSPRSATSTTSSDCR